MHETVPEAFLITIGAYAQMAHEPYKPNSRLQVNIDIINKLNDASRYGFSSFDYLRKSLANAAAPIRVTYGLLKNENFAQKQLFE